jgi:hypothetical protein
LRDPGCAWGAEKNYGAKCSDSVPGIAA